MPLPAGLIASRLGSFRPRTSPSPGDAPAPEEASSLVWRSNKSILDFFAEASRGHRTIAVAIQSAKHLAIVGRARSHDRPGLSSGGDAASRGFEDLSDPAAAQEMI